MQRMPGTKEDRLRRPPCAGRLAQHAGNAAGARRRGAAARAFRPERRARSPSEAHEPSMAARELYLEGTYLWQKRTRVSLTEAVAILEKTVGLDPDYAPGASRGLPISYSPGEYGATTQKLGYIRALRRWSRAIALDPTLDRGSRPSLRTSSSSGCCNMTAPCGASNMRAGSTRIQRSRAAGFAEAPALRRISARGARRDRPGPASRPAIALDHIGQGLHSVRARPDGHVRADAAETGVERAGLPDGLQGPCLSLSRARATARRYLECL